MTHRLKVLGLTLIALLATSALASAAQAGEFEADEYPVTYTGSSNVGEHSFSTSGGTVKCTVAYHGEEPKATLSMPLTTNYSGCTAFGFASGTMTFLSCHTRFTAGETVEGVNTVAVETDFSCEAGGSIVITGGTCEITIETNQSFAGGLAHNGTTAEGKSDIEMTLNLQNVKYIVDKDGFLCPFPGTGTFGNGVYRDVVTLEGEKPTELSKKIGIKIT